MKHIAGVVFYLKVDVLSNYLTHCQSKTCFISYPLTMVLKVEKLTFKCRLLNKKIITTTLALSFLLSLKLWLFNKKAILCLDTETILKLFIIN